MRQPITDEAAGMSDYIDQQGFKIKTGVAYLFRFSSPGPDVTALVVESLNEDGTVNTWDVNFKMKVDNVKPDRLWRPLQFTWGNRSDRSAVIAYAGSSALDLTP
jgi:hypothetical protein